MNILKNLDVFGHKIDLKFNSKGTHHKTIIGGIVSILINMILLAYTQQLIFQVINRTNDTIKTSISS